jgi:hypothetical protein
VRIPNAKPGTTYTIKASADSGTYQGIVASVVEYKIEAATAADSSRL